MKLPENAIGISDLLAHLECGRRMSYSMRRHTGPGRQSDDRTPEAQSPATAYGSAIHDVIQLTEDGLDDDAAVRQAFKRWGKWLAPSDLDLLQGDLRVYRQRDFPNTRTVAAEDEFRVPILVHDGEQIYFRFKLDRLYERLDSPGVFIHVDYKSSKHAKSEKDVHQDLQMWAYNYGIHEVFPEVDHLHQVYDQLRYGQIATHKTAEQRDQIQHWLIMQITAVLEDDDVREDGLLAHSFNQWCPWCPLLESCPVVGELSDFALTRIDALAPQRPVIKKDGTPGKRMVREPLAVDRIEEYVELLAKANRGRQVLERFEQSVKGLLREMSDAERDRLGFRIVDRGASVFTADAVRALYEALGPELFEIAKITKTGLESALAERPDLLQWALSLADQTATPIVVRNND